MTRGNQRELARAKAMKKTESQSKQREIPDGLSVKAVKEQDADIMRRKQKEAEDKRLNAEKEAGVKKK